MQGLSQYPSIAGVTWGWVWGGGLRGAWFLGSMEQSLFFPWGGGGAGIGQRVSGFLKVFRAERSVRDLAALIPALSLCPLVSQPLHLQDGESLVVPSHKGPSPWIEGGQELAPKESCF